MGTRARSEHILVGIGNLVLNGALIVDPSAVGAPAFFAVGLDVVVAELTDLEGSVSDGPDRIRRERSPDRAADSRGEYKASRMRT